MKQNRKTLIVILLTVALFIGGFSHVEKRLDYKWDSDEHIFSRKDQLMNLPQNSVDVLFLEPVRSMPVSPPRLYEQTGMRSFNLGSALQPPLVVYYNLRETLTRHKPKVVVIDFSFLHTHPDPAHERHEVRYLKGYVDLQSKDLKNSICRMRKPESGV